MASNTTTSTPTTFSKPSRPPRSLDPTKFAEARASEIESLHAKISTKLNNDFRTKRNKRRRTTAFDNRKAKKRRFNRRKTEGLKGEDGGNEEEEKKVSRRVRRRIEMKMNSVSGFSVTGDGTKRLRTHVWHAKRFTMSKLWGYYLPLGFPGRGKGSRALLKRFREGVLVHDASYHAAVQLEGPEESILSILKLVLVPSPSDCSGERLGPILAGAVWGKAMLLNVEGPASRPVAPVTYMWRPIQQQCGNIDGDIDAYEELQGSNRQLWVWIHASAFGEGYDALRSACQKEVNEKGLSVNCMSLEGELATLEMMGPKAFQILQKNLLPVKRDSDQTWSLRKHLVGAGDGTHLKDFYFLQNEENITPGAVIAFHVQDPRILPKGKIADKQLSSNGSVECKPGDSASIEDGNEELFSCSDSKPDENGSCSFENNLWDIKSGISPPVEESVLCREKHHERMKYICLNDSDSELPSTSNKMHFSRSCPILLVKDKFSTNSVARWFIILPISWVRAFWISLVTKGAHAIGLREKHWISCEVGLPHFPSDFPDTNAYYSLKANEAEAADKKAELRPPVMRPLKVPVPPPWDSILVTLDKGPARVQVTNLMGSVTNKSVPDSDRLVCDRRLFGQSPNTAVVARTSSILGDILERLHGGRMQLFPQVPGTKRDLQNLEKEEADTEWDQNEICPVYYNLPLCFIRVHLRAFKEGFFEEGAVVCAPRSSDLSLLTSRSICDERKLQMPQSSVGSYFVEQSLGKWELQLPEDPVSLECHRWPIGFVTSGFVRGSKKMLAEAYCEAVLLAHLREEQWKRKPVEKRKKEIYVVVRNLRSSAYRLALATIILEQQEDDIEFM